MDSTRVEARGIREGRDHHRHTEGTTVNRGTCGVDLRDLELTTGAGAGHVGEIETIRVEVDLRRTEHSGPADTTKLIDGLGESRQSVDADAVRRSRTIAEEVVAGCRGGGLAGAERNNGQTRSTPG